MARLPLTASSLFVRLLPPACAGAARAWLCGVLAWLASGMAFALPHAPPLQLDAAAPIVEAWPAVTLLADPEAALSAGDAIAALEQFKVPQVPHSNLGSRPGVVWLRIPVRVPAGQDGRRILEIDSFMLEKVDVHVVHEGRIEQSFALGSLLPFVQRAFPGRAHAASLALQPGRHYEVLVRVQAAQAIVPIAFFTPTAFHDREAREQMLQGVIAGVGLCLLVYSLMQWASVREPAFRAYAVYVAGITMLSYTYFGLASQHLWRDDARLSQLVPPLAAYAIHLGIAGFTESVLAVRRWSRPLSLGLTLVKVEALAAGSLFALDLITFEAAAAVACVGSPAVMALAIWAAVQRMLEGDRPARHLVCGWVVYTAGMMVFIGMYQGLLPANYWTQHSLQFVSLAEMCMWMLVLGQRMEEVRSAAQRTRLERDRLHSLAHTDALTGLPNRRGLNDVLQSDVPRAAPDRLIAVYLLDLDGFKPINDRLGHDAGDELLVAVAQRLKGLLRASDTIARLGGDEFVVVAGQLPNDAEARRLGQKLLEGIRTPFEVGGEHCEVGLTVGYALAPLDETDPAALLKRADAAMYVGKQAGRRCLRRCEAAAG